MHEWGKQQMVVIAKTSWASRATEKGKPRGGDGGDFLFIRSGS